MAKKKLTKAQKKARAHARYVRAEYYKNFDAIAYMGNHPLAKDLTIPNKITMSSLKKIRKIYAQIKKEYQAKGYVLPSKKEMAKIVREEPTQEYRQYRAEPEDETTFNPDRNYIEDIKAEIESLSPQLYGTTKKQEYDRARVEEAKLRLIGRIDYAVAKTDETIIAEILAANKYVDRVFSISGFYAHAMIDEIDSNLIPLLDAAMDEALDRIVDFD